jgi:hypothetical protein
MRINQDSCSPEQLGSLRSVFDTVWSRLQAVDGQVSGPKTDLLRNAIARRVMDFVGTDLSHEEIANRILSILRIYNR